MRMPRVKVFTIFSILAVATVVQACLLRPGAGNDNKATNQPLNEPTGVPVPPGAETIIELAKADLAKRAGVSTEKIRVVKVEAVEWRDSSLGCPQPGMMYAQVITPGYRVVLSDGQSEYEYHTDRSRSVVLCSRRD